jgi:DNA repair exonuclease SbcCD ATPase subunit
MKTILWLTTALALAAGVATFTAWRTAGQLRAENASLQAERDSLKAQRATSEAQTKRMEHDLKRLQSEVQEVHKLRGEVNQLRGGAGEVERLRGENRSLRAESQQLRTAQNAPPTSSPQPAESAMPNSFPRDQWTFAGYATPESALVSAIWAMREGKPQSYLESLTPEEQARLAKAWENQSEAEIAAKHQQDVTTITGFRILDRQNIAPDVVRMSVAVDGTGRTETVDMKRVGTDWKFSGFIRNPAKQ